jgi:hypothetical protein
MPTIKELNQRHPSCDPERMADLAALYSGDAAFEKRLDRFLPQWEQEPDGRYALRKKLAHYRNYLGAVVDYFAALLFAGKPTIAALDKSEKPIAEPDPYYAKFREDCDGKGKDLELFFKEILTEAMVQRCAWFAIEHPDDEGVPPANLKELQQRGLGDCELCALPSEEIYDWETDDDGRLEWVIVHSKTAKRASVSGGRDQITERWTQYLSDRVDVYRIDYNKSAAPADTATVLLSEQESYPHRFGSVPVLCLELPNGLWAANKLKTPQLAHFRASNAQTWSLAQSCFAMMLFNVGNPEEFAKATKGAGKGFILGIDEKASWIAPPSSHFSAQDVEIKAEKDEIFRLAHQMALGVDNNAAALGRTAESKAADSEATRVILEAYGDIVVEVIERVYDLISAVRGDPYTWSIDGLADFATADVGALLKVLMDVDKIGGIPSVTFNHGILVDIAEELRPGMDEAKAKVVADEILASLKKAEELQARQAEGEAALVEQARSHMNNGRANGTRGRGQSSAAPGSDSGDATASQAQT